MHRPSSAPTRSVRIFAAAHFGRAPGHLGASACRIESGVDALAPVEDLAVTLSDCVLSVTIDRPDSRTR